MTGYNIEYRDTRRKSWQKAGSVDKATTSWTQNKLVENNEYLFRVKAVNVAGESAPLETKDVVKPQAMEGRVDLLFFVCREGLVGCGRDGRV